MSQRGFDKLSPNGLEVAMNKAGWQTKTFGDVLDIRNGKNQREVESADGEYPIYGSAGNVMGFATSYICKAGATIVGRKGNINTPIYTETNFWNVDTAFGLEAKSELDSRFLYYFCLSYDFSLHNRGTTIPSLVKSDLLQIKIQLPPPPEQQRIVGILDEAFDGIATAKANAEQNLQNARALFESHLQSVFTQRDEGWVGKLLSELCDIKHGFAFEGAEFSSDVPEGKPIVITPGNFTEDGKLLFSENNTKRFSGKPPAAFRFDIGDLVVVMTDLSSKMKILGKPAFVETDDVLHNQRIGRVVFFDDSVEKRFVYYFMMSEGFLKNIKMSATGTMVKHTAPSRILSNVISFPIERKEQMQLVAKLDALREETQRLESLYQRKLAALDELKKSLLHQAFSGVL
ncbi:MAG: restriction endonuclease subunit S [Nitrosomonadales bacterium]|nr:restriction endonuclease subunit S [Nitrosomonadales bacterium]